MSNQRDPHTKGENAIVRFCFTRKFSQNTLRGKISLQITLWASRRSGLYAEGLLGQPATEGLLGCPEPLSSRCPGPSPLTSRMPPAAARYKAAQRSRLTSPGARGSRAAGVSGPHHLFRESPQVPVAAAGSRAAGFFHLSALFSFP